MSSSSDVGPAVDPIEKMKREMEEKMKREMEEMQKKMEQERLARIEAERERDEANERAEEERQAREEAEHAKEVIAEEKERERQARVKAEEGERVAKQVSIMFEEEKERSDNILVENEERSKLFAAKERERKQLLEAVARRRDMEKLIAEENKKRLALDFEWGESLSKILCDIQVSAAHARQCARNREEASKKLEKAQKAIEEANRKAEEANRKAKESAREVEAAKERTRQNRNWWAKGAATVVGVGCALPVLLGGALVGGPIGAITANVSGAAFAHENVAEPVAQAVYRFLGGDEKGRIFNREGEK